MADDINHLHVHRRLDDGTVSAHEHSAFLDDHRHIGHGPAIYDDDAGAAYLEHLAAAERLHHHHLDDHDGIAEIVEHDDHDHANLHHHHVDHWHAAGLAGPVRLEHDHLDVPGHRHDLAGDGGSLYYGFGPSRHGH